MQSLDLILLLAFTGLESGPLWCSWRKNDLECSPAYDQGRGSACTTSVQPDDSWLVCLLLVKLSVLRCLRDHCLYFKCANRVLIKGIFVFSLDFMLTLKPLFYLEKYQFRQLKLVIHRYWPFNSEIWTMANCSSKKYTRFHAAHLKLCCLSKKNCIFPFLDFSRLFICWSVYFNEMKPSFAICDGLK